MLSERFRPSTFDDFVGQPAIDELRSAVNDSWNFESGGERWLFESDGLAGCGKTSAAFATARALGCSDFDIIRIDSRASTIEDFRELESQMLIYGWGPSARKAYIIDEIQHLNRSCLRMLLGLLENIPNHVIVIGTTTSTDWADDVDGLYSRWRRFRFDKPDSDAVATHLRSVADELGLDVPDGFRFIAYVRGKYAGYPSTGNNVRDLIEQLPSALRRFDRKAAASAA